jgi:hypothetical protein
MVQNNFVDYMLSSFLIILPCFCFYFQLLTMFGFRQYMSFKQIGTQVSSFMLFDYINMPILVLACDIFLKA